MTFPKKTNFLFSLCSFLLCLIILSCQWSPARAQKTSVEQKFKRLLEATHKGSGVVDLKGADAVLFSKSPSNYSLIIVATAMGSAFGCSPCREFDPAFRLVAKNYYLQHKYDLYTKPVFFAVMDYANGKEFFEAHNIQSIPYVAHFPASQEDTVDPQKYSLANMDADNFAEWASRSANVRIKIVKPFDYQIFMVNMGMGIFFLFIVKIVYTNFGFIIQNPALWSAVSLLFIVNMTSGYMYNQIRGTPYSGMNREGKMEMLAGGFQSQYQVETQIISIFYSMCGAAVVYLVQYVPKVESASVQRINVMLGVLFLLIAYSGLIAVFRQKYGGYPFRLLL